MSSNDTPGPSEVLDPEEGTQEEKPKLSLAVEVDSPSDCQRHITVTVSREDVDRYYDDAVRELMPKANVPGFRPGRAPRKLVENRFRKDMQEQIKGSLLSDAMVQIADDHKFSAISEPNFDLEAVNVPDEGPMTFEFDIEVRPEFETPEWKGLKLERPVREFGDQDVDRHLKKLLRGHGELVPYDGEAETGDYVTVNITFWKDDEVVSEAEEQTICIQPVLSFRDGRLEGFGKVMDGVKEGDTKDAMVTVSADADNEQLRGQELSAHFEVLEVKKLELPVLDTDCLRRLGDFKDEEQLRETIRNDLERQLSYHQQRQVRSQITKVLIESADWNLPPDLLRRQSSRELERAMMELRSSGFDEQTIRAHENELRQNTMSATARALKEHFILEKIAEEEEIVATDQDCDAEIGLLAMQTNESPRRVRARLEKREAMDALRNQVVERKVIEEIMSRAEFMPVTFKGGENGVEAVNLAISGDADEMEIPEATHGAVAEALRQPVDHT